MTLEHDQGDWLRAAFAHSDDLYAPSPVPLNAILAAGRARKKRRRTTTAAVAAAFVLALSLAVPLSWPGSSSDTAGQFVPAASPSRALDQVGATVAHGMVDGRAWSVALEFYPMLPNGYVLPHGMGKGVPSSVANAEQAMAGKSSLLCQRMLIGGVRVDHQGGPWSDCVPVDGAHDMSRAGESGLWGLYDKGLSGLRLFVDNPRPDVAFGAVHLSDGTVLAASTVTVPGTSYRAWAVAVPSGKSITAVDTFNAQHHLLSHDTSWH
jgi:hypothetical protein